MSNQHSCRHKLSRLALIAGLTGTLLFGSITLANVINYTVPVQQGDGWEQLTYNGIAANRVAFTDEGMLIEVQQSASPLIFPLPEAMLPAEISVSLAFDGELNRSDVQQGEKGADDFVFRLGLVVAGDKTLNFVQRAIAADWIKKLYSMGPDGAGIENIQFYNVYSDSRLAGQSREHPLSELMVEHFIAAQPADGELDLTFQPELTAPVLALWISIDGDDTKSSYQVLLKNLTLKG